MVLFKRVRISGGWWLLTCRWGSTVSMLSLTSSSLPLPRPVFPGQTAFTHSPTVFNTFFPPLSVPSAPAAFPFLPSPPPRRPAPSPDRAWHALFRVSFCFPLALPPFEPAVPILPQHQLCPSEKVLGFDTR
eukprot:2878197-Rhodomonas_salina.3